MGDTSISSDERTMIQNSMYGRTYSDVNRNPMSEKLLLCLLETLQDLTEEVKALRKEVAEVRSTNQQMSHLLSSISVIPFSNNTPAYIRVRNS